MTRHHSVPPLKLGIAGLGTVGLSVIQILQDNQRHLHAKLGRDIVVTAVSARKKTPQRLSLLQQNTHWYENALDMAQDDNVDVVVELIGGSDGIAYDLVCRGLEKGKHVITGNKALIAKHGQHLEKLCHKHHVALLFEAAVAGGIPAIKTVREALIGDRLSHIIGILNGTSNYILTNMLAKQQSLLTVLQKAQELGYAEADPTADIDGLDAGHKLTILTHLAFGCRINFDDIPITSMRHITMEDHQFAQQLNCRIKLLSYAHYRQGELTIFVAPCLLPLNNDLARVDGVTNAVCIKGQMIGSLFLEGPGAGGGPTALAVIADIADIACGVKPLPPSDETQHVVTMAHEEMVFYVRIPSFITVNDFSDLFAQNNIDIEKILPPSEEEGEYACFAVVTKKLTSDRIVKFCKEFHQKFPSEEKPFMMPLINP